MIITRRRLEIALGLLWLLDGALQFQPYMFSDAFFKEILGMANMGLPGPVSSVDFHVAKMLGGHPVAWNGLFASLQVALGLGLLSRRTANVARGASIAWALGVWIIGEGFGGMFMSGTSVLTGAPGAALLYALAAVLLWPSARSEGASVTDSSMFGSWAARGAWALLWVGAALLELEPTNHASSVPSAQLSSGARGEPGALSALNHAVGHLVAGQGGLFAIIVAATAVAVGLGVLLPGSRRAALVLGMTGGVVFGVVGQDIGTILTGRGTDPGTGPLLLLLALALWPRRWIRAETNQSAPRPRAPRLSPEVAAGARTHVSLPSLVPARAEVVPVRSRTDPGHSSMLSS